MGERLIRAAGGVLWRRSPEGVDVALVHRPGHDDWSLPKGTLARGEHPITAAYREVTGKTGVRPVLGRRLPTQRCRTVNGPKMVEYWTVRGQDGGFTATVEVDQRVWLSLPRARARLTYPGDAELLNALSIAVAVDAVVLVVRHGSAGDPGRWTGDDRLRPLDAVGRREARAVQRILPAFAPARLLSVPNSRCRDTLALLAADLGLLVESEQRLEEQRYAGQRAAGVRRIRELAGRYVGGLLARHGDPRPDREPRPPRRRDTDRHPRQEGWVWALFFRGAILAAADYATRPVLITHG